MELIELIDNIFQLIVTLGVGIVACIFSLKKPTFLPLQYVAGLSICWFVGTIYWTLYFVINGYFVYYFSPSELCYMGVYLFLIGVCVCIFKENFKEKLNAKQRLLCFIAPFFVSVVIAVCFITCGGLLWNLYYGIPLGILAYVASRNLIVIKKNFLFSFTLSVMGFVVFNNLMFLVSCFGLNNLYVFFDFMLTLTFPSMLFFVTKESNL